MGALCKNNLCPDLNPTSYPRGLHFISSNGTIKLKASDSADRKVPKVIRVACLNSNTSEYISGSAAVTISKSYQDAGLTSAVF